MGLSLLLLVGLRPQGSAAPLPSPLATEINPVQEQEALGWCYCRHENPKSVLASGCEWGREGGEPGADRGSGVLMDGGLNVKEA